MSKKKKIVLILAIVLVIGAGVGFYFYNKKKPAVTGGDATNTGPASGTGADRPSGSGFDEAYYLAQNPDVAAAVKSGQLGSGYQHYMTMVASGQEPNRKYRFAA